MRVYIVILLTLVCLCIIFVDFNKLNDKTSDALRFYLVMILLPIIYAIFLGVI